MEGDPRPADNRNEDRCRMEEAADTTAMFAPRRMFRHTDFSGAAV
jgi:hypothetical protein